MQIISIHSQKGGTGKTSIALSLVMEGFRRGKRPLLIDADLSGTSIRDMIHLKSGVTANQSIIQFFRNPELKKSTDFIAVAEINDSQNGVARELPVLLGDPETSDSVMPLVYKENHSFFLRSRFERLINDLFIEQQIDFIVVDNSPGSWGLTKAILDTVVSGKVRDNDAVKFTGDALLVSSADLNDISSSLRKVAEPSSPFLHILNKAPNDQDIEQNVTTIADRLDQKGVELGLAGYQLQAQALRNRKFFWCAAAEGNMATVYQIHTRGLYPISNIGDLVSKLEKRRT